MAKPIVSSTSMNKQIDHSTPSRSERLRRLKISLTALALGAALLSLREGNTSFAQTSLTEKPLASINREYIFKPADIIEVLQSIGLQDIDVNKYEVRRVIIYDKREMTIQEKGPLSDLNRIVASYGGGEWGVGTYYEGLTKDENIGRGVRISVRNPEGQAYGFREQIGPDLLWDSFLIAIATQKNISVDELKKLAKDNNGIINDFTYPIDHVSGFWPGVITESEPKVLDLKKPYVIRFYQGRQDDLGLDDFRLTPHTGYEHTTQMGVDNGQFTVGYNGRTFDKSTYYQLSFHCTDILESIARIKSAQSYVGNKDYKSFYTDEVAAALNAGTSYIRKSDFYTRPNLDAKDELFLIEPVR